MPKMGMVRESNFLGRVADPLVRMRWEEPDRIIAWGRWVWM